MGCPITPRPAESAVGTVDVPPATGEIYLVNDGGPYPRRVVVVSRDELNRGDYVVVVPFTAEKLEERTELPNCVPFRAGEPGIEKDCVAQAEQIATVEVWALGDQVLGVVPPEKMRDIVRAVGDVLGAEYEGRA